MFLLHSYFDSPSETFDIRGGKKIATRLETSHFGEFLFDFLKLTLPGPTSILWPNYMKKEKKLNTVIHDMWFSV